MNTVRQDNGKNTPGIRPTLHECAVALMLDRSSEAICFAFDRALDVTPQSAARTWYYL